MPHNPYQAPPPISPSPEERTAPADDGHRSFRLTRNPERRDTPQDTFGQAVLFALVQQMPILVLSAMILDGGLLYRQALIGAITYWILVIVCLYRRRHENRPTDLLFIKWGYLPLLLVTHFMWTIGTAVYCSLSS